MPALYDLLSEPTKRRIPPSALTEKARALLASQVPAGMPPEAVSALAAGLEKRAFKLTEAARLERREGRQPGLGMVRTPDALAQDHGDATRSTPSARPSGPDPLGEFRRGFDRGLRGSNVAATGAFVEDIAAVSRTPALQGLGDIGTRLRLAGERREAGVEPRVPDMASIRSPGDALDFAAGTIGSGVASSVPSIAGGLVGSAAGPGGAVAGVVAPSLVLNAGDASRELREQTELSPEQRATAALALGVPLAALDQVTEARLVKGLLSSATRRIASAGGRSAVAAVGRSALKGAATEGVTEGAQEALQGGTVQALDRTEGFQPGALAARAGGAAVAGALTGGALGGAGSAAGSAIGKVERLTGERPIPLKRPPQGLAAAEAAARSTPQGAAAAAPANVDDSAVRQAAEGREAAASAQRAAQAASDTKQAWDAVRSAVGREVRSPNVSDAAREAIQAEVMERVRNTPQPQGGWRRANIAPIIAEVVAQRESEAAVVAKRESIVRRMSPPPTRDGAAVKRSRRLTEVVQRLTLGKDIKVSGETVRVVQVAVYEYPGVTDPVRVLIADPDNPGEGVGVLRYGSVADFVRAARGHAVAPVKAAADPEPAGARRPKPYKNPAPGASQPQGLVPGERVVRMGGASGTLQPGPAVMVKGSALGLGGGSMGAGRAVTIVKVNKGRSIVTDESGRRISVRNSRLRQGPGEGVSPPREESRTGPPAESVAREEPKPAAADPVVEKKPEPKPKPKVERDFIDDDRDEHEPIEGWEAPSKDDFHPEKVEFAAVRAGTEGKTFLQAAEWMAKHDPSPMRRAIARRLARAFRVGGPPGQVWYRLSGSLGGRGRATRSHYAPVVGGSSGRREIRMSSGRSNNGARTMLHELIHAATYWEMRTAASSEAMRDMRALHRFIIARIPKADRPPVGRPRTADEIEAARKAESLAHTLRYMVKNLDEMLTVGLSEPRVQEWLASHPYDAKRSMWGAFVDAIRKLLGLDKEHTTALDELLRVGDAIMSDNTIDAMKEAGRIDSAEAGVLRSVGGDPGLLWRENPRAVRAIARMKAGLKGLSPVEQKAIRDVDADFFTAVSKAERALLDGKRGAEVEALLGDEGPADDIPAGTTPIPPEGFTDTLGPESGGVRADLLAPWLWLKHLRGIPARAKKLNEEVGPLQHRLLDARGNVKSIEKFSAWEPDRYSESAWARLVAKVGGRLGIANGDIILTPDSWIEHKASDNAEAYLKAQLMWTWRHLFGEDAKRLTPGSVLAENLTRAAEGDAKAMASDPHMPYMVRALKRFYRIARKRIDAENKRLGLAPMTTSIEDYVGPHIVMGRLAETIDPAIRRLLGEAAAESDVAEARSRFLLERKGDPEYVRDAVYQALTYINATARYVARRAWMDNLATEVEQMRREGDRERAELVVDWAKASMMGQKNGFMRGIDNHMAALHFASRPPDTRETSVRDIAQQIGVDEKVLKKRFGIERGFYVPPGPGYVWRGIGQKVPDYIRIGGEPVGSKKGAFVVGRAPSGELLVVTRGAHLFADEAHFKMRPAVERAKKSILRLKARAGKLGERIASKLPGHKAGDFSSPWYSVDEQVQQQFTTWRRDILRSRHTLSDAAFRAMGDMQTRSVLGWNIPAQIQNFFQVHLTLYPEVGMAAHSAAFRSLGRPVLHRLYDFLEKRGASKDRIAKLRAGAPIARREALMLGTLQGETGRIDELTDDAGAVKRLWEKLGPMFLYRVAEDFTRGVAVTASRAVSQRMGQDVRDTPVKLSESAMLREWKKKLERSRRMGTAERQALAIDGVTMFNYNELGRSPIFSGPLGKLFGRLMTFPLSMAGLSRGGGYLTRPVGATAKVAAAVVRGILDLAIRRTTGRALGPVSTSGVKVPSGTLLNAGRNDSRIARGTYPAPNGSLQAWLEHHGARWHDRHGALVAARTLLGVGAFASIGMMTNLAALQLVGTPGWEAWVLWCLMGLFPRNDALLALNAQLMKSGVFSPERAGEVPTSPAAQAIIKPFVASKYAVAKSFKLASEGKLREAAAAAAAPVGTMLHEYATLTVPASVVLRRALQNMPGSERVARSPAGRMLFRLLNAKSYVKHPSVGESVKGFLRLVPEDQMKARRKPVSPPKKKRKSLGWIAGSASPSGAFA